MIDRPVTYTLEQLAEQSGFDKRTIAYYIQQGLLPKVGRRGPRTRYSRAHLDRLLFVRRLREAEARGLVAPLTLKEIGRLLSRLPEARIAAVAAGREDPERLVERTAIGRAPDGLARKPLADGESVFDRGIEGPLARAADIVQEEADLGGVPQLLGFFGGGPQRLETLARQFDRLRTRLLESARERRAIAGELQAMSDRLLEDLAKEEKLSGELLYLADELSGEVARLARQLERLLRRSELD